MKTTKISEMPLVDFSEEMIKYKDLDDVIQKLTNVVAFGYDQTKKGHPESSFAIAEILLSMAVFIKREIEK